MAYQAKRKKRFVETLELVDTEGNIAHIIEVSLDADDVVVKLNRKYAELTKTLAEVSGIQKKDKNDVELAEDFEKLGHAVLNLFETVFGKEDTDTIVDFYEARYIEMVKEVVPFIIQCVIPRCIEIKKENQKNILSSYNRKQRRALFRR